jgi:osmotically-inducible protein OsmY
MPRDNALQQTVLAALKAQPALQAQHVVVSADDGAITLTGHVPGYPQKQAARATAAGVRGVRGVVEEIEVRLPQVSRRTDLEIATAAQHSLAWDACLPSEGLSVRVEHGWVTLMGDVDWRYQRDLAQEDVRRLRGVIGVSNLIEVRERAEAGDIREQIVMALHRSWIRDPTAVTVTVEDGRVRLTGTVTTPFDRKAASAAAWAVGGVVEVDNEIEVVVD